MVQESREHYRHTFPPDEELVVRLGHLDGVEPLRGWVVNLSLAGMFVRFPMQFVTLTVGESLTAQVAIPDLHSPLDLRCEVIHFLQDTSGSQVGFRILPSPVKKANEARDKALWRFLLGEQVKARQRKARATLVLPPGTWPLPIESRELPG